MNRILTRVRLVSASILILTSTAVVAMEPPTAEQLLRSRWELGRDETDQEVALHEVRPDSENLPATVARLLDLPAVQRLETLA